MLILELDGDYTSFRVDIDHVKETFVEKDEVRAAFKNANLSPIELELIFAESFPYSGWREDVASKHITQKLESDILVKSRTLLVVQRIKFRRLYFIRPK